jgi:ATP-dependent exoDNAse (exonuclease V) alpha subunit
LLQPLQARAGAGKTHSLEALRAAAHREYEEVLVLIDDNQLNINARTVMIVDEASMVGTSELKKLLSCAVGGRAKIVLVVDAYQRSPVKARCGMFENLCDDLL